MSPRAFTVVTLLAAGLLPTFCLAESGGEEHSGGHAHHPNVVAIFAGVTSEGRRDSAATLGIEYERRLNPQLGVGLIIERAFGDLEFGVVALPVAYHSGPWKLYVAPGVEMPDERGDEFLLRFGVEYGFELGALELSPQVDLDLVDGETVWVFGLTLGFGF